jgi:GH15 family glucan-1,4-alpha-glucosidase
MPVYLPTAVLGNDKTLLTLGRSGEIMGWFYPHKDHAQNIYQCMPCVYAGEPGQGHLHWTWSDEWQRHQAYDGDSNVLVTTLRSPLLGLTLTLTDLVPLDQPALLRRMRVRNEGGAPVRAAAYLYGDWNLGGVRTGNSLIYSRGSGLLLQSHRDAAVAIGGDALECWQCGKAGKEWDNNAGYALQRGWLQCQDLEIGDVNWAFGFAFHLEPEAEIERTATFCMGSGQQDALDGWHATQSTPFAEHRAARRRADAAWLAPGLEALRARRADAAPADAAPADAAPADGAGEKQTLPVELVAAYKRSLLCLPLLCGEEGVALAAPEFDPEFLSCGGYGYFWPRDGGEYLSGLLDAGYAQMAEPLFDWCARHQDESGLWHQRYFLNGQPGPNWCLPPDMLQIDQVGAVLWAYGKYRHLAGAGLPAKPEHSKMVRKAADYLLSRLTEEGVHANAFDTWESFVGSFTYSNAAIYAALRTAHEVLGEEQYAAGARRVQDGVLRHFVREENGIRYLTRGFNAAGEPDTTVDSASLGAIEPFGLLDLQNEDELRLAEGTLRVVAERLETDWEGGRAIRRFEGDAYVGGVPACVNTLWMARCCLRVAARLREIGRADDAAALSAKARLYLLTVLKRATPTGLLPEVMQGPTGQH